MTNSKPNIPIIQANQLEATYLGAYRNPIVGHGLWGLLSDSDPSWQHPVYAENLAKVS